MNKSSTLTMTIMINKCKANSVIDSIMFTVVASDPVTYLANVNGSLITTVNKMEFILLNIPRQISIHFIIKH